MSTPTLIFAFSAFHVDLVTFSLNHLHDFFAMLAFCDFTDDIGFFVQAGEPDEDVVSLILQGQPAPYLCRS